MGCDEFLKNDEQRFLSNLKSLFCSYFLHFYIEERLDKNMKIYNVRSWKINNYNKQIAKYL